MAIINSYPIIPPTTDDLLLGTDVNASGQPTKNFTVQSIVDLVQGDATGLAAVLALSNDAGAQAAINFTNVQGSGTFTAGTFTDGTMSITSGTGVNFVSITSADFSGNLTGIVKAGSSIEGTVTGVTQPLGTDDTTLATTAFVQAKVDPSVLQYLGDATGPFDLNLVSDDFKISGTANQIETTAVNVAAGIGEITLSFPTAGVTLPDGSTATTQALTDNSTNVATTAFVHGKNDAQDLNFSGTTGTGSVLINSQTLSIAGTTNEITTSASNQTLTIGLPTDVTIAGIFTGATFSGDLNGTINTATTGVTQSAGDDSTKIATTAYVDAAAGAKTLDYAGDTTGPFSLNLSTDDLEFNGDSNITVTAAAVAANKGIVTIDLNNDVTISGTLQAGTLSDGTFSGTAGTYTGGVSITSTSFVGALTGNADTATALAVSGAIALTGDTTSTGGPYTYTSGGALSIATTIADTTVTAKVLTNLPTPTSSAIAATDTILAAMGKLQGQIDGLAGSLSFEGTWDASTDTPTLSGTTPANGVFYIVSVAGNTDLDGITDWQVGDWAIYVDNGAGTDAWQKLDQSNEVLGSGAANKIAKWTSTNTLATGLIEDDGTDVTVGNSGNLIVEGNTTLGDADTDTTTVKGPGVFEETAQFNVGIGLSSTPDYGTAGQVLTSGGGSATANTWTTPTTGTVTSVTAGTGITIGGTAADPTVAIDYLGTDNAILSTPQENAIATTDTVWFSDATDDNIKKTTVANLIALDPARSLSAVLAVGNTSGANDILMADSQAVKFGAGNDLTIQHNGTNSSITNNTGQFNIYQLQDDGDIKFFCDDGSGGNENYFQIDGGEQNIKVFNNMRFSDDVQLRLGTGNDLRIYHDATDSIIDNRTGNLILEQNQDDGDIVFKADNGSGGVTEYFRVDGGAVETRFSKSTRHFDDVGAYFGDSADLQIYHDASDSYILNSTGSLIIGQAAGAIALRPVTGENGILIVENAAVTLYYDNSAKLATTSSGIGMRGPRITFDPTPNSGSNSEYGTIIADSTYGLRLRGSVSGTNSEKGGIYVQQSVVKFPGEVVGVSSPNPQITMMQINRTILGSGGNVLTIGDATSFGLGYKANSVFQGDVDIKGDLTVDGHVIHGNGGGIFNGDQAITTAGGGTLAFTLTRATTGTMVFDVWLTSETGTASSVAKKYTVAHSYNTTPVYNKIIDTGPRGSADFTVSFINSAVGATGTSCKCILTAVNDNQNIGYTVQVGHDSTNALTFTAAS